MMNKEERWLVKEIKKLISPSVSLIKLSDDRGVAIVTAWVGDWRYTVEEVCLVDLGPRKKTITFEDFQEKIDAANELILAICKDSDRRAREKGVDKYKYFEDLLEATGVNRPIYRRDIKDSLVWK